MSVAATSSVSPHSESLTAHHSKVSPCQSAPDTEQVATTDYCTTTHYTLLSPNTHFYISREQLEHTGSLTKTNQFNRFLFLRITSGAVFETLTLISTPLAKRVHVRLNVFQKRSLPSFPTSIAFFKAAAPPLLRRGTEVCPPVVPPVGGVSPVVDRLQSR